MNELNRLKKKSLYVGVIIVAFIVACIGHSYEQEETFARQFLYGKLWEEQSPDKTPLTDEDLKTLPLHQATKRLSQVLMDAAVNVYYKESKKRSDIWTHHQKNLTNQDKRFSSKIKDGLPLLGFGIVISETGYVMMNYKAILNVRIGFTVHFMGSDKEYKADFIGAYEATDTVLLKIKAKEKFPYVLMGTSSSLQVGQAVVGVGVSFDLRHYFTCGVISGLERNTKHLQKYQNFIQVDANVASLGIGTALFNLHGELIGFSGANYTVPEMLKVGSAGISLFTPIDEIKIVLKEIEIKGRFTSGWMGVEVETIRYYTNEPINGDNVPLTPLRSLSPLRGVEIVRIVKGGPADAAGLKIGNILTRINEKIIKNKGDFVNVVSLLKPGSEVKLEYVEIDSKGKLKQNTSKSLQLKNRPNVRRNR